mgnify:CR=1 FL=1|tara:strand:+ start:184 stop:2664 length:2481 start_codon:yes stop_codon:yes gene_type:complete
MAGISVGFLNFKVGVNSTDFTKKLNKMQRRAAKFGRAMQKTGQSMTMSLTLPLVALGAGATKVFMDFEQGMLKVAAVSGATDTQMKMLSDTAKRLGASTMFSASQVAELQLNLSKLGLTPDQIDKATESILRLSQATGEDLGDTATVVASTMAAFGMTASETQRITDVMADSFSSTALDLEKFKTAMATLAPVAKESGVSIEQASALVGLLANNGVDASTAGTALRNIFLDLSKSGMSLDEAMAQINNSTEPLTTAFDMFGKRGATVATILSKNQEEIQKLTQDFIDSKGEAQGMADTMDKGLAGSMRRLKSQTEAAGISLGEVLAPAVDAAAGFVGDLLDKFTGLSDTTKTIIVIFGGFLAVLGPLFLIVGKLAMAYVSITKAIMILRAAQLKLNLAFLMNPIFLVITLIVGLVTAFVLLYNNVEQVRGAIGGLFQAAKKVFTSLPSLVMDTLGSVGDILIGIFTLDTDRILKGFRDSKKTFKDFGTGVADEFREGYQKGIEAEPINVKGFLGFDADDIKAQGKDVEVETDEPVTVKGQNVDVDGTGTTEEPTGTTEPTGPSPFEIDIDALKRNHKKSVIALKENLLNGKLTKEEFNQKIREEELAHLEQMKMVNEHYGKDILDLEEQIVDSKQNIFDNTPINEFEGALGSLGDKIADFFGTDVQTLEQGMKAIMDRLKDELAQGADSFEEYAQNVKKMLKDIVGGLISKGVAAAVSNAMEGMAAFPGSSFLIPVIAGAAAGLARTAFNSLIPAFAQGGLVTGPTLGLIGEGIGTNASNPEVIAPLDKLKGFMNGGDRVVVEGVIKGNDIFLSNQRTKQSRFRTI